MHKDDHASYDFHEVQCYEKYFFSEAAHIVLACFVTIKGARSYLSVCFDQFFYTFWSVLREIIDMLPALKRRQCE